MSERNTGANEDLIDLHRRHFLRGVAASPFAGAALATGAGAESTRKITVSQGGTEVATVVPYSHGMNVERFYSYNGQYRGSANSSANTPADVTLEQAGVSQLFFHEYDGELSLVMIHDEPGGNNGSHRMKFTGLPDTGEWAVKDDPTHAPDEYADDGSFAEWGWGNCCTDGGAYRWSAEKDVEFTVTPAAHSSRADEPFDGLHTWKLRSGDGTSHTLNMEQPIEPITVKIGASKPLTLQKQELIDTIRADASDLMLDHRAENLDQRGQQLLVEIDQALSNEDETFQYEEALERMLTAESVTESATRIGKEPTRETLRNLVELLIMIAFIAIAKVTVRKLGRAGSIVASKLDDVAAKARRSVKGLTGHPALPTSVKRKFASVTDEVTSRVDEWLDSNSGGIKDAGEELVSGSSAINDVLGLLSGTIIDGLAAIKQFAIDALSVVFYDLYMTDNEEFNDDGERIEPPGIGRSINNRMEELDQTIDEEGLKAAGAEERAQAKTDRIDDFQEKQQGFLKAMEWFDSITTGASIAVIVLAAIAGAFYVISVLATATGIPILVAAGATLAAWSSQLLTIAGGIGAIIVFITGFSVVLGFGRLREWRRLHDETVNFVVNFETVGGGA